MTEEPEGNTVAAVRAMTKQSKRTRVSDQSRLFEDNVLFVRACLPADPRLLVVTARFYWIKSAPHHSISFRVPKMF